MAESNINEWTDKQKEENQRITEEYLEHPICCKCGKPLGENYVRIEGFNPARFFTRNLHVVCPDCGPIYSFSVGETVLFAEGRGIESYIPLLKVNYADLLAKKAHPDWWDFKKMLPVRKEDY